MKNGARKTRDTTKRWSTGKQVSRATLKGHGRIRISVVLDHETWIEYHRLIGGRAMSADIRNMIEDKVKRKA